MKTRHVSDDVSGEIKKLKKQQKNLHIDVLCPAVAWRGIYRNTHPINADFL